MSHICGKNKSHVTITDYNPLTKGLPYSDEAVAESGPQCSINFSPTGVSGKVNTTDYKNKSGFSCL